MDEYSAIPEYVFELVDMVDSAPPEHANENEAFLDENDNRFFQAVKDGSIEVIRTLLNNPGCPVNINAFTSEGETPLYIAVKAKRDDIVKELLKQGAAPRNALLQFVLDNDLAQIEMLLITAESENYNYKTKQNECYISPLILAAQLGHYETVHLLLKHDQFIEAPHKYLCECNECETKSDILRSQIAINRFRGLSSPEYMCLKYIMDMGEKKDPLTQAFELNVRLERRATEEPELNKEYLKLSERCKRFSIDLYNECRSIKEITALLDIDEKQFDMSKRSKVNKRGRMAILKTFGRAIDSSHKEFVAHPYTQQLLNNAVYSGFYSWTKRSFISKFLLLFLYAIIFPIFVGIYIVAPYHWISQTMRTPAVKFLSHASQFIIFLALLVASALRDNHIPTALEYLIFICILGMVVQEFFEFLSHRPRRSYFFKWWNIVMTVMLILFVLAFVFWVIGFAITGGWSVVEYSPVKLKAKSGYQLLLLGNSFFSLATVVSVFHLVDLCQISSVLGPLQLSLYRMLRDVLKFLLFFFAIFIAFSVGVRNLYSYYNSIIKNIDEEYDERNTTRPLTTRIHSMSTFAEATRSMFWALFDKIDLGDFDTDDKNFSITQQTGKVLFAFYSTCAVMVAVNMLIAMMSHSYEIISEDEDIQWKFSRTRLWLEFIGKGSSIPPPYNLIPNPRLLFHMISKKFFAKDIDGPSFEETEHERLREAQRKRIIKNLVRRYFSKRKSLQKKELSNIKDLEECKNEILEGILKINAETVQDEKL